MTDDQLELANAYLDGEATAGERTLVESDAELLAEVERLRSIRNVLGEIEPPSPHARESAIAAALAAFDDLPSTVTGSLETTPAADPTAPTNIVPFDRRRRLRRLQGLSVAAAAIAIVAGGITIAQRGGGSNDASVREPNSAGDAPADTERDEPAPVGAETPTSALPSTTSGAMMAVVPTTAADEAEAGDQPADAVLSTDPDAAEVASSASAPDDAAAAAAPTMPSPPAPVETLARLMVLRNEDDLIDFAETMKDQPLAQADAEADCDDGTLKADAVYQDDDGAEHPIVVVLLDEDGDPLGALSLDDCTIVLQAD